MGISVGFGVQGVLPGFSDPVRDSQQAFRAILDAVALPGSIHMVAVMGPLPPPLNPATTTLCLALADYETPIFLDAEARTADVQDFLRFHTGAVITDETSDATFAVITGKPPPLDQFKLGSDEFPEEGATLFIQVETLSDEGSLDLSGPGIETECGLGVSGLHADFWDLRAGMIKEFPRGVDLIFTSGRQIAALPRTTIVSQRAATGR